MERKPDVQQFPFPGLRRVAAPLASGCSALKAVTARTALEHREPFVSRRAAARLSWFERTAASLVNSLVESQQTENIKPGDTGCWGRVVGN